MALARKEWVNFVGIGVAAVAGVVLLGAAPSAEARVACSTVRRRSVVC